MESFEYLALQRQQQVQQQMSLQQQLSMQQQLYGGGGPQGYGMAPLGMAGAPALPGLGGGGLTPAQQQQLAAQQLMGGGGQPYMGPSGQQQALDFSNLYYGGMYYQQ